MRTLVKHKTIYVNYNMMVLRNCNDESNEEELWALVEFDHVVEITNTSRADDVFENVIGRAPDRSLIAENLVNGGNIKQSKFWVSGPITEQEASLIKQL